MSLICLVIAIVLFVLVGLRVEVNEDIELLGFGLLFFAASFIPWHDYIHR